MTSLTWTTVLLYGETISLHILISYKSFKTDWQGSSQKTTIIKFADWILLSLGWMNVKERYQYFVATFIFKYYHGALPPNLRLSFLRMCGNHHCSTRLATSSCLLLPKPRTELLKRSLPYSGPFVWNCLPNHLKEAASILSFKCLYKIEV